MPKLKMTDASIRNIKPPATGRVDYYDANTGGKLVLRVGPTGVKAWSVVFRVAGGGGISRTGRELRDKQRRLSLGTYPGLSLSEARTRASAVIEEADKGIDPRAEKLSAANDRYESTVERVADRMLDMEGHKSVEKYRTTFRLHINPHIGKKPITELTVDDIDVLLKRFVDEGKEGTAREVRKMMRKVFGWAKKRRILQDNFMADYERKDIAYKPRDRVLNTEELKAVWNAAKAMPYPHGPIIQLLMLTGLRKSEITKATWSELDHENQALHLGKDRSKTRDRIFAPMSDDAWAIIKAQPEQEGPHIFSTTEGELPSVLGSKVQAQLYKAVGFDDFTFHDLRRTLRTRLAMLGVERDIAERIINHSQGKDQYDQYGYQNERRAALNLFAEHLKGLIDD